MKNPLIKRLPRELKSELGKYIVLFIFMTAIIGFISGFFVASGSLKTAYDESFEKYNIEDGNFELYYEADASLIETLEKDGVTIKIHTNVLYDENGNIVTESTFEGTTINVKGIVDRFSGEYQIKVISMKYITIQ